MGIVATAYENLTVSTAALQLTAATFLSATGAIILVEDAAVRFRLDGTDPSTSVGLMAEVGSYIYLTTQDQVQRFRVIRRDSGDAILRVQYGKGMEGEEFRVLSAGEVLESGYSASDSVKAEDSGHTSGDTGDFVLAVRNSSYATLTSADLDYSPFAVDDQGRLIVYPVPRSAWTASHAPSAATQATATKASAGAGLKNVCTSIAASFIPSGSATAVVKSLRLRDGATGAGTILWEIYLGLQTAAGQGMGIAMSNLWIPGTAATAMTIEFESAGGSNTLQSVSILGLVSA